jgi:hypothetical protein
MKKVVIRNHKLWRLCPSCRRYYLGYVKHILKQHKVLLEALFNELMAL